MLNKLHDMNISIQEKHAIQLQIDQLEREKVELENKIFNEENYHSSNKPKFN